MGFHTARRASTLQLEAVVANDFDIRSDALVARAFDRVLDAERAAQMAIGDCERQIAAQIEHARQEGRAILERAQARIVALHTRAEKNLELRSVGIAEQRRQSAAEAVERLSDPARRARAVERLAAHLTLDEPEASSR